MNDPTAEKPSRPARLRSGWPGFAFAGAAVGVATLARLALDPILGDNYPFPTYFLAVAAVAWVGRTRPAVVALALSGFACSYLFMSPRHFLVPTDPNVFAGLALFLAVGGVMVAMGHARRGAVRRAERLLADVAASRDEMQRAAAAESEHRERLRTTLASIGDAVISTDRGGNVTYLNPVAEAMTGWTTSEAAGQPLTRVFRVVNAATRQPIENPALRAFSSGVVVGLEGQAVLVAKDGTERPIDDSVAPIRCKAGEVVGSVLVFRDVSERRAAELAQAERLRLVALRAGVAGGTAAAQPLRAGLQQCCEAVVKHLGVAFARVWTHDEAAGVLELQASAGLYTNLDGPHSRVRLGEFKIGRIASDRTPVFIDDLTHDASPSDSAWPVEDGMVAFAGYPLVVEGRLVGVLATFSRHPLTPGVLTELAPVADQIAQFVDRKRAIQEVEVAERRYRTLASTAPVGIFETDAHGNCTFVNDRWCQLAGLTAGGAAGQGWVAALHPDDRDRVFGEWSAAATEGRDFYLEYRFRTPDGRTSWLIGGATAVRGPDGAATGYIGTVTDVTARRRAEERAALLTAAVESANDAIIITEADLDRPGPRVEYVNPAYTRMTGYTFAEAVGQTPRVLQGPRTSRELLDRLRRDLAERREFTGETINYRKDESEYIVEWRITPVLGAGGSVEKWVAVQRDVTDRRRTEERLRDGRERLEFALAAADLGQWELNLLDHTARRTPRHDQIFGYDTPLPGWSYERFLEHVVPDDRAAVDASFHAALTSGTAWEFECRIRRADGDERHIWSKALIRRDADGRGRQMVGIVGDMTDRKKIEEQLREADRRKDEFLATLAHELRNPLAPIRNGIQVMKLAGAGDRVEQARSMMDRQVTQLVRLVDDLLDISRVTSGKLELRRERLALREVIDAAVETSRPAIEQAGHELVVTVPDEPIYLYGDPARLAQVVSNLLNNSAKYTHRGGHIALTVGREGGTARVSVKDDGIGIPPAMLDKVFGMFAQVDRTLEKSTGGLGIGLSLVKGLVEMHGGTIVARSEGEGRGSEFVVRLPVLTPDAERADCGAGQTAEAVLPVARRVLVVDDNADAADSLAQLLELLGNEVRTANDGVAGVATAGEFRPAVVMMDIGMPKLNGYEAARRIRTESWGREVVLVALTGWGQDDDRRKTAEAGFDHHLVKPVDYAALTKLFAGIPATTG